MPQVACHHKRCWHPLARCVPYHKPQPILTEEVEVVGVSAHLPGRLVVGRDLPALQLGHLLGQRALPDASGYPKVLLYAFAHLLLKMRLRYLRGTASFPPLLGDLVRHYAVHDHRRHLYLRAPWHLAQSTPFDRGCCAR